MEVDASLEHLRRRPRQVITTLQVTTQLVAIYLRHKAILRGGELTTRSQFQGGRPRHITTFDLDLGGMKIALQQMKVPMTLQAESAW